jgi:hypothetical protein
MQKPNLWESISHASCLKTFKGISESSLRLGAFALEVAKYDAFIDWVENSESLYIGYDATSVACMSIQLLYVRGFRTVVR